MKSPIAAGFLLALLTVTMTFGLKAKPSDEFYKKMHQMCVDTNANSNAIYITSCYQYIRGFLQGAVVTENAIVKGFITGEFDSAFVDESVKAAQLNGNSQWRNAVHMSGYTGFCLPSEEVTHDVVVSLLKGIQAKFKPLEDKIPTNPLSEHLYELLMERYTCEWMIRSSEPAP